MAEVLLGLLPILVGASLVPLYPIIVLLLLQSAGGLVSLSPSSPAA